MNKFMTAAALLLILSALSGQAFAKTLHCRYKLDRIEDVDFIKIEEESAMLNDSMEIPLERSVVRCGNFGRQIRLDGRALGYQVVLKSCSSDARLEGHLIDSIRQQAVDIVCN
jgi:hypothetical protein